MQQTTPSPDPKPASSLKIYLRLLGYLKPLLGLFGISLVGYVIFASSQPMLAAILKYFVDGLGTPGTTRYELPMLGNIELMFPVPFLKDDRSLRLSTFLDGGTVFNKFGDLGNLMRYSAGLALTWVSPMGPLKVSIAQPLNDHPGDNLQRFQFMFGQQF